MFNIAAIDCKTDPDVCEKERVKEFPVIRVYPPQPIPAYDVEGELNSKTVMKSASRYVQSNIIEVSSANIDTFI